MNSLTPPACILLVTFMFVWHANAQDAALPRVGWEENFDNIDRWKKALEKPSGTPPASVEAVDGAIKITTACGALEGIKKDWPEWKSTTGFTGFEVAYDDVVDFDIYRYLVVRTLQKGTFVYMALHAPTKLMYTTGIRSQDLKDLGVSGKKRVQFYFNMLNSSGVVKIDSIRLVRELLPEEKAGFIGPGMVLREEKLPEHPYHGLEAFNARTGRPIKFDPLGGEQLVYRDFSTKAEVWKMTSHPNNETSVSFNCDGSAFTIQGRGGGGFHVYDFTTGKYTLVTGGLGDAAPRFSSVDPAMIIIAENKWIQRPLREISLHNYNFRTGEKTKIAAFQTDAPWIVQELSLSRSSSKMLFGFRETNRVYMIDPSVREIEKRVTEIKLPTRLKAVHLRNNDSEIAWYNCYTYEGRYMELATGKCGIMNNPCAGGHSAGGPVYTIGPYGDALKLLVRNDLHQQTEATADDTKIFASYKNPVPIDYGHVNGSRWMVTDGCGGDIAGTHLCFPLNDPAAALHIVRHHTSRNDWVTNTYSWSSRDGTKLAWPGDQFDNGDIYMAITGRPAAPGGLTAERQNDAIGVALEWKAPAGSREVAGYRVYRSALSGGPYVPLNREPMKETAYFDEAGKGKAFYIVVAVEPSGLESAFTEEVAAVWKDGSAAGGEQPRTIYLEAEHASWKAPARLNFMGDASGSHYLRIHHALSSEPRDGEITFKAALPPGEYSIWLRGRAEGDAGAWQFAGAEGNGAARFESVPGPDRGPWSWVKLASKVKLNGAFNLAISGGTPGLSVDQIALSSDVEFDPNKRGIASGPLTQRPAPISALEPFDITTHGIKLRWKASPGLNIARYDIHACAADGKVNGNETVIGSTRDSSFEDWGLCPGTKYTYSVVAVDSRGNVADPVNVDVTTAAQPVQTSALDIAAAERDPRLAMVESLQKDPLATLPKLDEAGVAKGPAKITYTCEVKDEAPFMLWAQYRPAYVSGDKMFVEVEIDGKPAGKFQLRHPYAPMAFNQWDGGKRPERIWCDKLILNGKDVFTLTPGKHTVSLLLDPKLGEPQHAFGKLYLSNDHSFRPSGYNPRANFLKKWY